MGRPDGILVKQVPLVVFSAEKKDRMPFRIHRDPQLLGNGGRSPLDQDIRVVLGGGGGVHIPKVQPAFYCAAVVIHSRGAFQHQESSRDAVAAQKLDHILGAVPQQLHRQIGIGFNFIKAGVVFFQHPGKMRLNLLLGFRQVGPPGNHFIL